MARPSEENQILLQNQLTVFAAKHEKEVVKKHFRLFTLSGKEFCIHVAWIKGSTICIETYWKRGSIQSELKSTKIYNRQLSGITNAVMDRLNRIDLSKAIGIKITSVTKPKRVLRKRIEQKEVRYKRNVRNKKVEENKSTDTTSSKPTPTTAKEIKEAKLERKIFSDPKMHKWKY
jgi:hypothetical protein